MAPAPVGWAQAASTSIAPWPVMTTALRGCSAARRYRAHAATGGARPGGAALWGGGYLARAFACGHDEDIQGCHRVLVGESGVARGGGALALRWWARLSVRHATGPGSSSRARSRSGQNPHAAPSQGQPLTRRKPVREKPFYNHGLQNRRACETAFGTTFAEAHQRGFCDDIHAMDQRALEVGIDEIDQQHLAGGPDQPAARRGCPTTCPGARPSAMCWRGWWTTRTTTSSSKR